MTTGQRKIMADTIVSESVYHRDRQRANGVRVMDARSE